MVSLVGGETVQPVFCQQWENKMLRPLVSILAGIMCGAFLGLIAAVCEFFLLGMHSGFGQFAASCELSQCVIDYSLNGSFLGAVGGIIDFVYSIRRPKVTGIGAHVVFWAAIAGLVVVLLTILGGWPDFNIFFKFIILALCCCLGGLFGFAITIAIHFLMAIVHRMK